MATTKTTPAKKAPAKRSPARKRVTKKPEHPLAHLIPSKEEWLDTYVRRTFPGWTDPDGTVNEYEDLDILKYCMSNGYNVQMFGPTGPGKTHSVYAFAAQEGMPVVNLSCEAGMDTSGMFVNWIPHEEGPGFDKKLSDILLVIQHGGVLYIDEGNFMPSNLSSLLHPLLDRRGYVTVPDLGNEQFNAHPDLFIVLAFNPDYVGTKQMNEAFNNRFAIMLEYGYDREIEEIVVAPFEGADVSPLLDLADRLRSVHSDGIISTPISTNILRDFVTIATDTTLDFAIYNFLNRFHVDERAAVQNVFDLERASIARMLDGFEE